MEFPEDAHTIGSGDFNIPVGLSFFSSVNQKGGNGYETNY
jgi:hypothetical protein